MEHRDNSTPTPTEEQTSPPRRRGRGLPDLSSLFDEIDQSKPSAAALTAAKAPASTSPGEAMSTGSEPPALTTAAPPILPVEPGEITPTLDPPETDGHLAIPPELQAYLPPDLWRRLNVPDPARGVLINALERVRSALYNLSTFLPRHLVQEKMRRPYAGVVKGQMLSGALLFSDVSGFTALSERLASLGQEGAERLTAMMNDYFTVMLDILAESDGILLKFAGDAMLVYFPEQEGGAHAAQAVRAGRRMLKAIGRFAHIETPLGTVGLKMKIGLASGQHLAASVGVAERTEYIVTGPAIADTMAAESLTTAGGQIVMNPEAARLLAQPAALTPLKNGFALLAEQDGETLDDFEIQAQPRRARGVIPWNATSQAILAQIEIALRQIEALVPYLAPELVERLLGQSGKRSLASQFRPTTVMFMNFIGPETLLERWGEAGAARVTSLLNAYFCAVHGVIAHYGGIVSRIDPYVKGTKMLILFGAPVAHEDDAQRAAGAALALNVELEALEQTWRARLARHIPADWTGPLIQQRIGITFGYTFAGQVGASTRREYTVMGDEVNLSARLMSAAEMGCILVSKPIQEMISGDFVLTARPPVRLKGKKEPAAIFQIEGMREDALAQRFRSRSPLVGRKYELARLSEAVQELAQGRGRLLILQGPPGIGKSHLADEVLSRAEQQGLTVWPVLCRSFSADTQYAPWSQLLRLLAGITSLDYDPQIQLTRLTRLLTRLEVPEIHVPPLAALAGVARAEAAKPKEPAASPAPPQSGESNALADLVLTGQVKRRRSSLDVLQQLDLQASSGSGSNWREMAHELTARERDELHASVWALLERLAHAAPAFIFFEDAHWMDPASRSLLAYVAERISPAGLLVLLARRAESAADSRSRTLVPLENEPGEIIEIPPLDASDTFELVARQIVSGLAEVIYQQSHGNPLFAGEITAWLLRTYRFDPGELKFALQTSDFLQKLVMSSLESLPVAQREVIQVASVLGAEFRLGEVNALLSEATDPVTLSGHLRALVQSHLIHQQEIGADPRYVFQQDLVREVLYNSLPHERRRELHARAAAYMSTPQSARRKVQARLASFLEVAAGNPALESETVAAHYEKAQDWLPAARQYLTAARRYMEAAPSVTSNERAAAAARSCLENLGRLAEDQTAEEATQLRRQANLALGDHAMAGGDYLRAISAYEAARACPSENETQNLTLVCRLALALPTQGRANEAIHLLQEATGKGTEIGEYTVIAAVAAWLLQRSGNPEAGKWVDRARGSQANLAGVDAALLAGLLHGLSGDWAGALAAFGGHLDEPACVTGAALACIYLGDEYLRAKDAARALEYCRQAVELWRPGGGVSLAHYREAEACWQMGCLDDARQALQAALAALDDCSGSLRVAARGPIQKAFKLLSDDQPPAANDRSRSRRQARRWPVCDWQAFADEFTIRVFMRLIKAEVPMLD